ncbi:uncharacterized protein VTP21DRAFT_10452 [Calcarisporiella thermophila]|uniref:uncharacterized protein n=1 Tax=Calcarisporiella thermophila TaxID=911321 RepID=UPI003743EA44
MASLTVDNSVYTRWCHLMLGFITDGNPTGISRLSVLLHQLELCGTTELHGRKCTGIVYITDPFRDQNLPNLFNKIDRGKFDLKNISRCLHTDSWSPLLKKGTTLDSTASSTLESLCLLTLYIPRFLDGLQKTEDDSLLQDILSKKLPKKPSKVFNVALWQEAFKERNLRLYNVQDMIDPTRPAPLNLFLNEALERIRLANIDLLGRIQGRKETASTISEENSKQMARILSTSFYTILEFSNWSLPMILENIVLFSTFADKLPTSWFTPEFLDATIQIVKRLDTSTHISLEQTRALTTVFSLWSAWLRRLGQMKPNDYVTTIIDCMNSQLTSENMHPDMTQPILTGLAFATGKFGDDHDVKLGKSLYQALEIIRTDVTWFIGERADILFASIAHFFLFSKSTETLRILTQQLLDIASDTLINLDAAMQLLRLFQFVWADKKRRSMKQKFSEKALLEWRTGILDGIDMARKTGCGLTCVLASGGVLRASIDEIKNLQSRWLKSPKKYPIHERAMNLFLETLRDFNGSQKYDIEYMGIPALSFACARCLPDLPRDKLKWNELEHTRDLLLAYLLRSDLALECASLLADINEEIPALPPKSLDALELLPNTSRIYFSLQKRMNTPLYREVGRVSRSLALLLEAQMSNSEHPETAEKVLEVLKLMHAFTENLVVDWDRCIISDSLQNFVEEIPKLKTKQGKSQLNLFNFENILSAPSMLWRHLKVVLFSYTMVFQSIMLESTPPISGELDAAIAATILQCFASLNFIIRRVGPGFTAYERILDNSLHRIATIDGRKRANLLIHQEVSEWMRGGANNVIIAPDNNNSGISVGNWGQRSKLLFWMDAIERLMPVLEDEILEEDVIPLVFPYLRNIGDKDLYESAHSVVLALLSNQKRISKQVSIDYADILLSEYPSHLTADQLRVAYTSLIQSLSLVDDAVTWLLIDKLIKCIEEMPADPVLTAERRRKNLKIPILNVNVSTEKTPAAATAAMLLAGWKGDSEKDPITFLLSRNRLIVTLMDQLRSVTNLSLYGHLLKTIRRLVLQESSPYTRHVLLKSLLNIIGGDGMGSSLGLDETKRPTAVRWYLDLKQEVESMQSS